MVRCMTQLLLTKECLPYLAAQITTFRPHLTSWQADFSYHILRLECAIVRWRMTL